MNLPKPPKTWTADWEQQLLNRLSNLFDTCFMKRADLRLANSERLILTDTVTGQHWNLYVESGVVKIEEVA